MDKIILCEWCGNPYKESARVSNTCMYCGGSKSEPKQPNREFKSFYKDWVVYCIEDMSCASIVYRFYDGKQLQAEIEVPLSEIAENVEAWCDPMPYIEKRLEEKGVKIPDVVWTRIEKERYKQVYQP